MSPGYVAEVIYESFHGSRTLSAYGSAMYNEESTIYWNLYSLPGVRPVSSTQYLSLSGVSFMYPLSQAVQLVKSPIANTYFLYGA